jgi:hypothetical protein
MNSTALPNAAHSLGYAHAGECSHDERAEVYIHGFDPIGPRDLRACSDLLDGIAVGSEDEDEIASSYNRGFRCGMEKW